jgi:RNA polymerase-associated protein RTF1
MADLDAELLALAGGDSSGEEESLSPPSREKSSSPPRSSRPAQDSATDMARKGIAKPVAKSAKRTVRRRKTYSNDEDDA